MAGGGGCNLQCCTYAFIIVCEIFLAATIVLIILAATQEKVEGITIWVLLAALILVFALGVFVLCLGKCQVPKSIAVILYGLCLLILGIFLAIASIENSVFFIDLVFYVVTGIMCIFCYFKA